MAAAATQRPPAASVASSRGTDNLTATTQALSALLPLVEHLATKVNALDSRYTRSLNASSLIDSEASETYSMAHQLLCNTTKYMSPLQEATDAPVYTSHKSRLEISGGKEPIYLTAKRVPAIWIKFISGAISSRTKSHVHKRRSLHLPILFSAKKCTPAQHSKRKKRL